MHNFGKYNLLSILYKKKWPEVQINDISWTVAKEKNESGRSVTRSLQKRYTVQLLLLLLKFF